MTTFQALAAELDIPVADLEEVAEGASLWCDDIVDDAGDLTGAGAEALRCEVAARAETAAIR